jgi:Ca2+-binding RTX toxin-like protein
MHRTSALLAGLVVGLLALAPSAHATLTVSSSGDTVIVTGDAGSSQILMQDGDGAPYAFAFYSENGETVEEGGGSTCGTDGGSPVENIYCGNSSVNKVLFDLGGGNDSIGTFNDDHFDILTAVTVDLGAGNDDNEGGAFYDVPTTFRGGEGDDVLAGQEGPTSVVEGGAGADRITGGGALGGETLRGGAGDDEINGLGGNDQLFGDEGADALIGGQDGDTITGGPGLDNVQGDDTLNALSGNDTIHIEDGERDVAGCGFGADTVFVDALDLLPAQDCESVNGPRPGAAPPPSGGGGPAGGGAASAKVSLAKPGKLSARKRRLAVRVSCPASANGRCAGRVTFRVRFTERRKKRSLSLGSASFTLQPGASRTVGRKLSKKVVRRLRRATKRRLTVRATSRDAAGTTFTSSRTGALAVGR